MRTTGKQPSDSRMVQRTRLKTSVKQWKRQTKHNHKRQHTRLIGQHSQQRHQTSLGQAGQTLRNIKSSQHSSSQMMKNNNKAQEQKQYRQSKDNQKANNASQIRPATIGLCTHGSMEDTSISTAYTDSHNTSNDAISKQNNYISEGCSNKHSSRKQETKHSTVERTTQKRTAEPTSPMATSPAHQKRPSLPAPPHTSQTRERDDTIAEGSTGKQQRTTAERQTLERPTTAEQPKSKMRINAIKSTTKDGDNLQ